MVQKTKKRTHHKKNKAATIPELRRSFEHIERIADEGISKKESTDKVAHTVRNEWRKTFGKELDTNSAILFVTNRSKHAKKPRRSTRKHRGGSAALAGAPLDYTTRQGMYLAPQSIPDKDGHLPLTGGKTSSFGSYLDYVSKGFGVGIPEMAQDMPYKTNGYVQGMPPWPSPPAHMGSNTVHFSAKGGANSRRRKLRKGGGLLSDKIETTGALLSQAFARPAGTSIPPNFVQDLTSKWYGTQLGPSSDQVQRPVSYQIGNIRPQPITF
jgi:hypothetical protein